MHQVISWLVWQHWDAGTIDFILNALETSLAQIPLEAATAADRSLTGHTQGYHRPEWRRVTALMAWLHYARYTRMMRPDVWTSEQESRFFGLLQWLDQPVGGRRGEGEIRRRGDSIHNPQSTIGNRFILHPLPTTRLRPQFTETLAAYKAGVANETDLLDFLIGEPERSEWGHDITGTDQSIIGTNLACMV